MQFPFDQFAPDAGELAPGVLMQAEGVLPRQIGYGPAKSLVTPATATALTDPPRGLFSLKQRDGTNVVYGFTETDAYQLGTDYAWGSAIGTGFSCTTGDDWSGKQFGDKLLVTNTTDGLQAYDIETPAGFSPIAAAQDPKEIFVCANVVVGLDTLDGAGNRDTRLIRTSAIGDHTEWAKKGADRQPLEDGGNLVAGCDLKNNTGLIFQTDAMRLIQFGATGAGAFSLVKVADGRGAVGARSVVSLDGKAFWLSEDGFKSFSLAEGIQHIGGGKVDDWFLSRVALNDLGSVQAVLDPLNKVVLWRYTSLAVQSGNTGEPVDYGHPVTADIIGYSWQFNKWFTWRQVITYFSRIATPGYTLDAMDGFGALDSIDMPLDSAFWQGGAPVLSALSPDLKYSTFSGANFAATLESGFSNSPVTGLIGWATPIDDSPDGTLAIGVKDALSDAVTWKTGAAKVSAGRTPQRARGMNIGFLREIPAGSTWTYSNGVDHIKAATGGPK